MDMELELELGRSIQLYIIDTKVDARNYSTTFTLLAAFLLGHNNVG